MSKEVSMQSLSPKEWAEIKQLAMQIYKSGQHNKDHLKCSIHAFVIWLVSNEANIVEDYPDPDSPMH